MRCIKQPYLGGDDTLRSIEIIAVGYRQRLSRLSIVMQDICQRKALRVYIYAILNDAVCALRQFGNLRGETQRCWDWEKVIYPPPLRASFALPPRSPVDNCNRTDWRVTTMLTCLIARNALVMWLTQSKTEGLTCALIT